MMQMNKKLKEFVKETKQKILQSQRFIISDPTSLSYFPPNFSLHDLNQLKILVLTWNLGGSVI